MKPEILTAVLAIAASAAPVICLAASADEYSVPYYSGSPQHQPVPKPLSMMNLSPRKPLVRPYGEMGRKPEADHLPTAVSYRPFANGPVGTVGLVHMTASHALDSTALGNASAGQPGAPSQTVGANLLYAFH
ncbi:MAG TPA: hypothetical protein VGG92_07235 [Caulobacteraceae bacterium]|jgi:hypothetical protein